MWDSCKIVNKDIYNSTIIENIVNGCPSTSITQPKKFGLYKYFDIINNDSSNKLDVIDYCCW